MNIEEFIRHIEAEFEDLEPGKLKPKSNFREMFDWNSVNALILIAMVSTEYDVTLTAQDIRSSNSIEDIYRIVESKIIK